jgi:hypothetical protein
LQLLLWIAFLSLMRKVKDNLARSHFTYIFTKW